MGLENAAPAVTGAPSAEASANTPDIRRVGIDPDFWYPLARSKEVKRGKMRAVSFAGQAIVLARTKAGELFAVEDRCAHRQVPLHVGVVDDDGIRCGYHGWKYDCTGKCVNVPYLDKCTLLPNSVRSYPCREAYGLVFVFPGAIDKLEDVEFPDIPTATDPRYKTRYLDQGVACHYTFMHENLMDMNHQFLHRRLMGRIGTTFLGHREGDGWVEADFTFKRPNKKQPVGEKLILWNKGSAAEGKHDLMTIRTGYPYQTLKFWTAGSEQPALDLWNVYVPTDEAQRANHTFGLMMIRRPSIPGLIQLFWPLIVWFTNGIFTEDRTICELEQAAFDRQGADHNHEIFPAIRALRKVLVAGGVAIADAGGSPGS